MEDENENEFEGEDDTNDEAQTAEEAEEDADWFTPDLFLAGLQDSEYICKARQYFLTVVNTRLLRNFNCFKDAVKELECSIKDHLSQIPSPFARPLAVSFSIPLTRWILLTIWKFRLIIQPTTKIPLIISVVSWPNS